MSEDRKRNLSALYEHLLTTENNPVASFTDDIDIDDDLTSFRDLVETLLINAEQRGRTGKLWVQYIRQVLLLLNFIRAERTGDWSLHLQCVEMMIPHFHAAGHLPYAKSARLYLQKMKALPSMMPLEEYQKMTSNGLFTIRRTDSF